MKRTALKRKAQLKAKAGIKRTPMKPSRKTAANKRARSDTRWRSDAYLEWVRTLPCSICAFVPSDAHHVIGLGWGLSGVGLTAPDSFSLPLCRACHSELHHNPWLVHFQPGWLVRTLPYGIEEFPDEPELARALAFVRARESSE